MEGKKLTVLWTNDNVLTAKHMVLMYTKFAMINKWWDSVTVIIWGATALLVAKNEEIQEAIKEAEKAGVVFKACIACATNLGVLEEIKALGFEVAPMGLPLTNVLQSNEKLITI